MTPKKVATEVTSQQCAAKMMETLPIITQFFRAEMRRNASFLTESLSVPQFRMLAFLDRHPGASMKQVAEHLGVTRATASNLIERLVQKNLVSKVENPQERRHVVLNLTEIGKYHLQQVRAMTSARIASVLADLPKEQLQSVVDGLTVLYNAFEQTMMQ
ncbi:MarR family winged helix-turn-helix transcriptional regulator [Tolypothrix sp. VBCCA 56010]|uniref:MarR family winged helix-turn-helix transcriptional regulator n=1 Tax=Tolypothrix sp. VBCCA 56010 TaxID=3137731 RepID=UPI003D7C8F3D